jgi:hypothetical protein
LSVDGSVAAGNLRSINGIVNGNGSIFSGTGFSSVENYAGNYTVTFPDGSFSSAPVFVILPFNSPETPVNLVYYSINESGTASFTVDFQGSQPLFFFTANQVNPGGLPASPGQLTSQISSAGGKQIQEHELLKSTTEASSLPAHQGNSNQQQQKIADLEQRLTHLEAVIAAQVKNRQ